MKRNRSSRCRRAFLLTFAALALPACRPTAPPEGTLIVALSSDPGHLNPAITTQGGVHTASALLYDGLIALAETLQPVPALARSWTIEDSGRRYRFHLRTGVRWHDGQPFTSADVKFSFDSVLLRFHARTRASLGAALASVEAPDDSTVEFRFKRPYPLLLQQLTVGEAPMVPRHVFANTDPATNPATRSPIGTGPFQFVSYQPDREIRYAANRDYFGSKPRLGRIVIRILPDPGMQMIALEAGEVDWVFGVPGPDRTRLAANPAIRMVQSSIGAGGSNCVNTLAFNLDRRLFQDLRVRRAVAQAVDRAAFVDRITYGGGRASAKPISSQLEIARADDLSYPAFDTSAAGRLLDSAGWRLNGDGIRVAHNVPGIDNGARLTFGFTHMPPLQPYGDLLRAQLRVVGIDLRLQSLEPAVFADVLFKERAFDTGIISYCNGTDPEIGVRRMYVSSNIAPVPFSNAAGYRNAVVDSLFDAARATLDPDERRRDYRSIQLQVLRDLPYLSLVETVDTRAYRTRCSGFQGGAHFAATARCGP